MSRGRHSRQECLGTGANNQGSNITFFCLTSILRHPFHPFTLCYYFSKLQQTTTPHHTLPTKTMDMDMTQNDSDRFFKKELNTLQESDYEVKVERPGGGEYDRIASAMEFSDLSLYVHQFVFIFHKFFSAGYISLPETN
jgi:hypothetical protein